MKRLILGMTMAFWFASGLNAEAGLHIQNLPVVSQIINVGLCVLTDSGTLAKSALAHLSSYGQELLQTVSTCIQYAIGQVGSLPTAAGPGGSPIP